MWVRSCETYSEGSGNKGVEERVNNSPGRWRVIPYTISAAVQDVLLQCCPNTEKYQWQRIQHAVGLGLQLVMKSLDHAIGLGMIDG
jgi:hypothetical protein